MKIAQLIFAVSLFIAYFNQKLKNLQILQNYMNSIREFPPQYLNSRPIIDSKYKVLFKLGTGRFSKVKMAIKLDTNERVAVKIMNEKIELNNQNGMYQSPALQMFLNEMRICLQVKNKYIVQIIDFNVGGLYETADGRVKRILYYVMKMAGNGQLFRIIKETQMFSEKIARCIFRQLIAGVQNMHQHGIAHRDLKPQNILIDQSLKIKIADFGYATNFVDQKEQKILFDATHVVGSTKCNAPQLTNCQSQGTYFGDDIDVFACGCVLFEMVMKSSPFKTSDYKDQFYNRLIKNDKQGYWDIFSANCCPSQQFRDLIQRLLNPNPKIRLTIQQIKQHPWYRSQAATRKQFKKDMSIKLKKVTSKIRKQQQQQIKTFFKRQRTKSQYEILQKTQKIRLSREVEKQIIELKELIYLQEVNQSDSSSNFDKKEQEERMQARMQDIKLQQ